MLYRTFMAIFLCYKTSERKAKTKQKNQTATTKTTAVSVSPMLKL